MFAWVTARLIAPGVQRESGSENRPDPWAWHEPGEGWGWTTCEPATLTGSDVAAGSAGPGVCGSAPSVVVGRGVEAGALNVEVVAPVIVDAVDVLVEVPASEVVGAADVLAGEAIVGTAAKVDELLEAEEQPAAAAHENAANRHHVPRF